MVNIIKKELNQYFKGMFGYFFGAVLLMFAGVYTLIVNCSMGYASFEYTLNNMAFMYLILIPILTMRSVSEERKQRTDQLLYSLPLRMSEVIFGKYLAILIVLGIPTLIIGLHPLILMRYGAVSLRMAYITLIAFFILGAALSAIGVFISTLTENQAIAAGLSFAVFLIAYFGSNLTTRIPGTAMASLIALIAVWTAMMLMLYVLIRKPLATAEITIVGICILCVTYHYHQKAFEGLFVKMAGSLSLFERFYAFVRGVLDLRSVVYFISVIALFLFLSVQSLEKRRWS